MSTSETSPIAYPANRLNRAGYFKTMFDVPFSTTLYTSPLHFCYTASKGTFLYKPNADNGRVGRTAAGYLAQRSGR